MATIAFLLHITIWNYDTGDMLWDLQLDVPRKVSNALDFQRQKKLCLADGIAYVRPIVEGIRTYIPNASANVTCEIKHP